MSGAVLTFILPLVGGLLAGAVAGGLTAWRLLVRQGNLTPTSESVEPTADPFVDAEIDIAAARWGAERNQPAAAVGLMSDHLKQLYRLGLRKGWF